MVPKIKMNKTTRACEGVVLFIYDPFRYEDKGGRGLWECVKHEPILIVSFFISLQM